MPQEMNRAEAMKQARKKWEESLREPRTTKVEVTRKPKPGMTKEAKEAVERARRMTKEEVQEWVRRIHEQTLREREQLKRENPEEYERRMEAARWAQHTDPPPDPDPVDGD